MTEAHPPRLNPRPGAGWMTVSYLMLFLSLWFFVLSIQEGCYQRAQKIQGIVLEKGYQSGTGAVGQGGTGTRSYHWVRYRFTTPEGETKEHVDTEVLPGTWRNLQEGAAVDIGFMQSLADSRVAGQKASSLTFLSIAVVLLLAGIVTRRAARKRPP